MVCAEDLTLCREGDIFEDEARLQPAEVD